MTVAADPGRLSRGVRSSLVLRALGLDRAAPSTRLLFAAAVALGAALRLPYVFEPLIDSFSWRQASTAMMADNFRLGGWNIFFPEVSWTGPGPSYQGREFQLLSYATALLHAAFGWHDWFGRLVAFGFSLVTLVSLHRLAALVWDEGHAHAVTLAYALMPAAIAIDTSFLPDPSMLALLTLGLWLYVRWWTGGSALVLALGAAAFTLGALCKIPGLSAGFAVAWLVGVAWRRGRRRDALWSLLACGLGMAAIVAYYAWAIHLGTSYPPYHVAGDGYIWDDGVAAFYEERFYLEDFWTIAVWWYYGWPLLALMVVGFWFWPAAAELRRDFALSVVPLAWLLGAVAVYVAGAKEITANPWNLHMFHVPLAFVLGRAIVVLLRLAPSGRPWAHGLGRLAVLGTVVLLWSILPLLGSIKQARAAADRELGQRVAELRAPDDLAILVGREVGDPIALYYSRGRGWVFPPGGDHTAWSIMFEDDATAIAELERLRAEGADWFGVVRESMDKEDRVFLEHHPGLIEHLNATGTLVEDADGFLLWRLGPPAGSDGPGEGTETAAEGRVIPS